MDEGDVDDDDMGDDDDVEENASQPAGMIFVFVFLFSCIMVTAIFLACHFSKHVLSLSPQYQRELFGIPSHDVTYFIQERKKTVKTSHHNRRNSMPFTAADEVILYLIFFKFYLTDILLSAIMGLSKSTVHKIHSNMHDWFYNLLSPQLSFRSFQFRSDLGVKYHKNILLTYIIDGSEQQVPKPKNRHLDGLFYSAKKKMHSINLLIKIAFNGIILGLSSSQPGGYNDRELVHRDAHSWISKLHSHEHGMGDAGFRKLFRYRIVPPPPRYTRRHSAFSHYRIKVENAIANIKNFAITSSKLRIPIQKRNKILSFHHKAWTIASVFVNRCYNL